MCAPHAGRSGTNDQLRRAWSTSNFAPWQSSSAPATESQPADTACLKKGRAGGSRFLRFLRERTRTIREWMAADTLQRGGAGSQGDT